MKAMVLAAGLGTRRLPLTKDMEKPAVPLATRSLIHGCLEWVCKNDVDRVVNNLPHHSESVISVIEEHSWPVKMHLSAEPQVLGTAKDVKKDTCRYNGSRLPNQTTLFTGWSMPG